MAVEANERVNGCSHLLELIVVPHDQMQNLAAARHLEAALLVPPRVKLLGHHACAPVEVANEALDVWVARR